VIIAGNHNRRLQRYPSLHEQLPLPWHLRASGGAVHSIINGPCASRICGPSFRPHAGSRESGGQVAPHMIRGEVFREQATPGLGGFGVGARVRVQRADQVSNLLRIFGNESALAWRER
jgi:hypothetical protein